MAGAAPFCASCTREGPGLRPRRLDDDGPLFLFCERCDSEVPGRKRVRGPGGTKWIGSRYYPLDELERALPIMILKALRRSDWVSASELAEMLTIPSISAGRQHRNKFSVQLSRMAREGYVESKDVRARALPGKSYSKHHPGYHGWKEYRITPLGIAKLEWSLGATLAAA